MPAPRTPLAALLALAPLALGALAGCGGGTAERPPNLLLYVVDTLRADHLGCYGYGRDTSPRIDRLASEGTLFERAYSLSNWTQPAMGSLITSLPPFTFDMAVQAPLPQAAVTLAEILADAGYRTAGFTANAAVAADFGFDQGFETYVESDADLDWNARKKREGAAFDADTLNELAFAWLAEHGADEPFFLYVHSVDPHAPLTPPVEFDVFAPDPTVEFAGDLASINALNDSSEVPPALLERLRSLYDAEIRFNDHEIGRLLDELARRELLDRTLVVFVSDHGEEYFERGAVVTHGHDNLHQELTHVPLVMRLPGRIPSGRRVPDLVSGVDVLPTVLELLGIPRARHFVGHSLVPLLEGSRRDPVEALSFRSKEERDHFSLRTDDWFLHAAPDGRRELYAVGPDGREAREDVWPELDPDERAAWEERLRHAARLHQLCDEGFRRTASEEGQSPSEELAQRLSALGYLEEDD